MLKQSFKAEEIKIYMLYKKVIRIMFRMPSAKYRDGSINVRISLMIVLTKGEQNANRRLRIEFVFFQVQKH